MIKIKSFSPLANFTRRTWRFYDSKMAVRTKSLTSSFETEIQYEKIKVIQSKKVANVDWYWVAFAVICLQGITNIVLGYFRLSIPNIHIIEKAVIILALASLISAFRKYDYFSFLDIDKSYLATIKVDSNNKNALLEAINLIKQKTELINEIYPSNSLPNTPPVFEFTEFDLPDFFNKSTVRFYEDKIIDVEKSLVEEVTTVIKYDELSGKTKNEKRRNDNWFLACLYWLMLLCIIGASIAAFFSNQMGGSPLFRNLYFGGGLVLSIPMFYLQYIKSEFLIFYGNKDNEVFWTKENSANREKLDQIVEFIQERVSLKK
jgi:hypothetical protein